MRDLRIHGNKRMDIDRHLTTNEKYKKNSSISMIYNRSIEPCNKSIMSQTISETELTPHRPSPTRNAAQDDPSPSQTLDALRPITPRRQAVILLSSFLTICITIGFNQSYGVFQSYYTSPSQTLLPEAARAQSAWVAFVGALGAGLTWGGSIFVNPLMARVRDVRWLTVTGVVFMSAGFGLASFGSEVSFGEGGFCLCHLFSLLFFVFLSK
jgi:hypothetical protein